MHPILARGSRLALYLLACAVLGAVLAASLARAAGVGLAPALAVILPLAVVYGFVCLSSWYVCRATPIRTSRPVTVLVNLAGATLVAGGCWLVAGYALARLVSRIPAFGGADAVFAQNSALLLPVAPLTYLLTAAASYAVMAVQESRANEQRALEMQLLAREAELRALRAQVAPHFLFNSLNSISALTTADPAGARRMAVLLADFLRTSLRVGARDTIPFAEELALTRRFLDIEQVRFGPRLGLDLAIEEGLDACLVPPLLLQPLAENAVAHGIGGLIAGGTIRLEARRREGRLEISFGNPYDRDRPPRRRGGVGLENVRRRLANHYGSAASLEVQERDGAFRVTVSLPCEGEHVANVATAT